MQFRKDINGLRAIAVIAVVLFHFNASWLPGGFAGVDVFFVISGFLMTRIIFKGLTAESFSLLGFYTARAKRIIPALTCLCIVLLVFGWFFLTPNDYIELGKHVGSSIGFFSNFIYWSESGYFASASHDKWLLHTWSLSAEWQFYIIYPIFLILIKRTASINFMRYAVLIGTGIGFVFCVLMTYKWPDASYYLLPTRAWEMMLGGVAYLFPLSLQRKSKVWLEYLGIVLIVASCIFISKDNLWPGALAAIPVLGAFFILQANNNSILINNKLCEMIGLWSYSIYLWHWPIVVSLAYFQVDSIIYGLMLSVMLGAMSYYLIEKSAKHYSKFKLAISACVILFSILIYHHSGFNSRFDPMYALTEQDLLLFEYGGDGFPLIAKNTKDLDRKVLLIGDSYSRQYLYGLKRNNVKPLYHSYSGCLIFPDLTRFRNGIESKGCSAQYDVVMKTIFDNKPKKVILAFSWNKGIYRSGYKHGTVLLPRSNEEAIDELTSQLDKMFHDAGDNISFYIISDTQGDLQNTSDCIQRRQVFKNECLDIVNKNSNAISDGLMFFASKRSNVTYINPNDYFCDGDNCLLMKDNYPVYYDETHYSKYGSLLISDYLIEKVGL